MSCFNSENTELFWMKFRIEYLLQNLQRNFIGLISALINMKIKLNSSRIGFLKDGLSYRKLINYASIMLHIVRCLR
jgi:hypothetical protein